MFHSKQRNSRSGNAVVEYILITALMALATVAIFRSFRNDMAQAYKKAGEALIQGVDQGIAEP
ncbi:MAG: hypothetical protein KCHDKBKB_01246 [Elusimicrobia bacterium]|nr:hypothetical protein [Elusimicrobiota bacterium]